MQDLNDFLTGDDLTAAKFNEPMSEIQNVIEGLGIALSGADLNQLGKAIAGYVANGNFYTDSGAADAYVLTKIGLKQTLPAYTDGMAVEFIAGNTSTGASTVNVAGLGVKNIVDTGTAGIITAGLRYQLRYRSGSGNFEIVGSSSILIGYTSTEQTLTSAGALVLPHLLGTSPVLIQARLVCQTAQLGHSIGDEVIISNDSMGTSSSNKGLSIVSDATNIDIRFASAATIFNLIRKDTGVAAAATNANWKLVVRAWK